MAEFYNMIWYFEKALRENVNLIDIDENNVDEALFYAKEDYWKKANAAGRSQ